jgi:hypothetical protein
VYVISSSAGSFAASRLSFSASSKIESCSGDMFFSLDAPYFFAAARRNCFS